MDPKHWYFAVKKLEEGTDATRKSSENRKLIRNMKTLKFVSQELFYKFIKMHKKNHQILTVKRFKLIEKIFMG